MTGDTWFGKISVKLQFLSPLSNANPKVASRLMDLPTRMRLEACASGKMEVAQIEYLDREVAKHQIDNKWWDEQLNTLSPLDDEPDSHWKWREIISYHQNDPKFTARCVRTEDGSIQGALLLRKKVKSVLEPGEKAVFIDRVATSPWNRDKVAKMPRFRGVGTGFVLYSIVVSYYQGFGGRVNLQAVASEDFYAKQGFEKTTIQQDGEIVWEIRAKVAQQKLIERGIIDA